MNEIFSFGVDYDKLPIKYDKYPDVFFMIFRYFEKSQDFKNIIFLKYRISSSIQDNTGTVSEETKIIFNNFVKMIKELPQPFIPKDLVSLYLKEPCKAAAFSLLAALPASKNACLSKFIDLLTKAKEKMIHPLDYDEELGLLFARQRVPQLFNFLTKQSNFFLSFPMSSMHSFVEPRPITEYPDLDDIFDDSLTYKSMKMDSVVSIFDLYKEVNAHANYLGLNSESLGEIDEIPLNDAKKHCRNLKIILKDFEKRYENLAGKCPNKQAKEQLSALYHLRQRLKKRCERNELTDLIREKTALQVELNEFRDNFEKRYGRSIMYEDDKKPAAQKYERYKEIKQKIAELQQK